MKTLKFLPIAAICLFFQFNPVHASPIALPDYSLAGFQYGDFYSYSLSLLNIDIASSGGQIKGLPVLATGSSAANNTPSGMDDAYLTSPSIFHGNTVLSSTFSTAESQGSTLANGKGLTNSWTNTWDINLGDIQTFIGLNKLVILFDNNQSQNESSPILQAYGQIVLRGSDSSGVKPIVFDFVSVNNNNWTVGGYGAYAYTSAGMNFQTIDQISNYVSIPNKIIGTNVDSNKGNNKADFAIYSPELQALLDNPSALTGFTTMSFFVDFGNRTAGNEQIFLATADITSVPEPGTMLLMGIGAAGAAFMRRRKARFSH